MDISNQLKKAINLIPKTSLVLSEFLAVIKGIKPVMIQGISPNEIKLIKTSFPELNIACHDKVLWNRRFHVCALSKNKSLAKKAIDLYCLKNVNIGLNIRLMGESLGYPKCCVENYVKYINQNQQYNSSLITYQAYKATKKFNPFVNNLLNFSTRLHSNSDRINFDEFRKINLDFWEQVHTPPHYFQFISHIPCRYDCPESIKLGKKIQNLLKKYAPDTEKIVTYTLSKPILFFDLFKLVIFDGYFKDDTLYYQRIIPPSFLIDNLLMEKIKSGNKIIVDNKKIKILKDRSLLFVYQKKNEADGFILDFNET
jgi:hypothetical protein